MTFTFRHRFQLPQPGALGVHQHEWALEEQPQRVRLTSADRETALNQAGWAILLGEGYPGEAAAYEAGLAWRSRLERAFACLRVPANFGDRAAKGFSTKAGLRWLSEASSGQRVLNDEHGLMVYETEPSPVRFVTVGPGSIVVTAAHDRLEHAITSPAASVPTSSAESIAFTLYSESFTAAADARLMLLMMAIETLLEQLPRDAATREHVQHLIEVTRAASLPDQQRNSVRSGLEYLKQESIGQAGRRLAATLEGRCYGEWDPVELFTHAYTIRSKLAHGEVPRPSRSEVEGVSAPLEVMVGDLIAGRTLVDHVKP